MEHRKLLLTSLNTVLCIAAFSLLEIFAPFLPVLTIAVYIPCMIIIFDQYDMELNKIYYIILIISQIISAAVLLFVNFLSIIFILISIGLFIFNLCGLNIEYVAIMAILIGFVDLLPLFGAGFIMVPWTILLLIQGNVSAGIAVFALWITWSVIKQFLEPKVVSKQMGMHPIFTLIGMYTGFKLFGVIGLLLGPIMFLVIREVFSNNVNKGILKDFFELE